MVQNLPNWLLERYSKLWFKFKNKEFTRSQAEKTIGKKAVAVFLSDLRKAGWMEIKMSKEDARKTIYNLKEPTTTFLDLLKDKKKHS